MNCKNCHITLQDSDHFCSKCGAKIIKQRLSVRILLVEFFATFISWDNKILKTFMHLITNPEKVINKYINGTRKRYVKPFTYLLIVLTIYGIYFYFVKDIMINAVSEKLIINKKEIVFDEDFKAAFKKINLIYSKFSNLFIMSLIPLYAVFSKSVYKKQKYNFVEHVVIQTYIQSQFLIISSILVGLLLLFSINILIASNIISPLMYLYYIYVFKKVFNSSYAETVLKFLLIILLFIVLMILISISVGIVMIIYAKLFNI